MRWIVHGLIVLTSVLNLAKAQSCSWNPYFASQSFGGAVQASITSLVQCQNACVAPTCLAIEWASGNSLGNQCFFFSSNAPPTFLGSRNGVDHYIWTCATPTTTTTTANPSGCYWNPYFASQTYGGVVQSSITSLSQCKSSCQAPSCMAIEWVSANSAGNQCYFFTSNAAPVFQGSRTGVDHYVWFCPATTTTTANPSGCSWNPYFASQSYGGAVQSSITSLSQCQNSCQAPSCMAIEWVSANSAGNQCFFFTSNAAPVFQGSRPGIDHYIWTCPPPSTTTTTTTTTTTAPTPNPNGCSWNPYFASQSYGGVAQSSITSLSQCQNACVAPSCLAIEWVSGNSAGNQCYFFTSNAAPSFQGSRSGVDHYIWTCPTTTTSTTTTTTAPATVAGCSWSQYTNSNTQGGVQQSSITSQPQCQSACQTSPTCYAYEWASTNSPGSQCYFFTSNAPPTNLGSTTGVNHYVWICVSSTTMMQQTATQNIATASPASNGCTWTATSNTNSPGGLVQAAASSLDQCKALCLNNPTACMLYGMDWNPNVQVGQQCWLATTTANSSYPGVTHYSYSCPSTGSPTPFIVPGCAWTSYANSNTFGGVLQSGVTSPADCQNRCFGTPTTCSAYEWAANASPGQQCFFFSSAAAPTNQGTATGVTHYIWTCVSTTLSTLAPGCYWNPTSNTNSPGGTAVSGIATLSDCQRRCLASQCTGIDWVPNAPSNLQCWISPSTTLNQVGAYPGCTHYTYICSSSTSPTALPQTTGGSAANPTSSAKSACSFYPYYNTQTVGNTNGQLQTYIFDQPTCQQYCIVQVACLAYEWRSTQAIGSQCWFFTDKAIYNAGGAPGTTHYVWQC